MQFRCHSEQSEESLIWILRFAQDDGSAFHVVIW